MIEVLAQVTVGEAGIAVALITAGGGIVAGALKILGRGGKCPLPAHEIKLQIHDKILTQGEKHFDTIDQKLDMLLGWRPKARNPPQSERSAPSERADGAC